MKVGKNICMVLFLLLLSVSCGITRNENTTPPIADEHSVKLELETKEKSIKELREERVKLLAEVAVLDAVIVERKKEQIEFWGNLVGGIAGALAVVCLVGSIFIKYPIVPTVLRYCSYGLALVSALAFTATIILPYAVAFSCLFMAILFIVGVMLWVKDRTALKQVVRGVEELKPTIPSYKEVLRKHINPTSDVWIDKVRQRL